MSVDINRARLIELAEENGVDPIYLEKDFILTEIVHAYATGPHREQLVLKGGQALRGARLAPSTAIRTTSC